MSAVTVYKASEAALAAKVARARIDAACASGALVAIDLTPAPNTKRAWRILDEDLVDWIRRGCPTDRAVAA